MLLVNCTLEPRKELRLNHEWTNPRWIVKKEYLKEDGTRVVINDAYMYKLRAAREYNKYMQAIDSTKLAAVSTQDAVEELVHAAITGGDIKELTKDAADLCNTTEIKEKLKEALQVLDTRYKR